MDAKHQSKFSGPIVVTGSGCRSYPPGEAAAMDVLPFLKSPKMHKYMGKQDQLAVVAARLALQERNIEADVLRDRTGIYAAVGYIPFERNDIETMARHSVAAGSFSMEMFATVAVEQVHPLLTFRCLPNMPIFHVSVNCGIQGPYFVTYPGVAQFYVALERAVAALREYEIDFALVGGVADQDNFLVAFDRSRKPGSSEQVAHDAAAFLVLERAADGAVGVELTAMQQTYRGHDPWRSPFRHQEWFEPSANSAQDAFLGAASLPAFLHEARQAQGGGVWTHTVTTIDGIEAQSRWTR